MVGNLAVTSLGLDHTQHTQAPPEQHHLSTSETVSNGKVPRLPCTSFWKRDFDRHPSACRPPNPHHSPRNPPLIRWQCREETTRPPSQGQNSSSPPYASSPPSRNGTSSNLIRSHTSTSHPHQPAAPSQFLTSLNWASDLSLSPNTRS